jgi:hypothetical protein
MKEVSMTERDFSNPFRNPDYAGYWDLIFQRVFDMLIPDEVDVADERFDEAYELASDITNECIAEVMAFMMSESRAT